MSAFFHLNRRDFINGAIVAVGGAVLAALAQQLNAPGFDYATFQWGEVLKVAFSAAAVYLSKNLLSTADGRFMGRL